MSFLRKCLVGLFVVAVLTGCGNGPDIVATDATTTTAGEAPMTTTTVDPTLEQRRLMAGLEFAATVAAFADAVGVHRGGARDVHPEVEGHVDPRSHGPTASATLDPLAPCGGDLPPCSVAHDESGGSYTAFNATGCDGRGCYGKWQFSGEWACKLGLPCDLSTATPEQQDAAARTLWAGGAGCSNWAACGNQDD